MARPVHTNPEYAVSMKALYAKSVELSNEFTDGPASNAITLMQAFLAMGEEARAVVLACAMEQSMISDNHGTYLSDGELKA